MKVVHHLKAITLNINFIKLHRNSKSYLEVTVYLEFSTTTVVILFWIQVVYLNLSCFFEMGHLELPYLNYNHFTCLRLSMRDSNRPTQTDRVTIKVNRWFCIIRERSMTLPRIWQTLFFSDGDACVDIVYMSGWGGGRGGWRRRRRFVFSTISII